MAVSVSGMVVPMPTAVSESPTDIARLPQAFRGLKLVRSVGKTLRSSFLLGSLGAAVVFANEPSNGGEGEVSVK